MNADPASDAHRTTMNGRPARQTPAKHNARRNAVRVQTLNSPLVTAQIIDAYLRKSPIDRILLIA
jgi:hypothetical protein